MPSIPLKPLQEYNFAAQNILVAGLSLSGFDDDGTVSYEPQSDRWSHSVGADGQTTISKLNDPRVVATLTVKESGRAYDILSQLHATQGAGILTKYTYIHRDPKNGDLIRSNSAVFLNYPGIEKAKEAGSREFNILLPNAAEQLKYGGNLPQLP